MFEGPQGETFEHEAAMFVRSQSIGLEGLKLSKKRDQKLASFLQERENHPYCRRLQLKDMLPAGFQRLSKYPLLLESLLGYTDLDKYPEEYEQISRSLDRAKEILASVNAAVREEENHQRLVEIQKRLDQSSMTKNKHLHVPWAKGNLDLTKHRLIYEGPLTWRLSKGQKNLELLVLVLEQFIVLLQKDSDKYILKNYSSNKNCPKEEASHSPIIAFGQQFLYRAVATDNCAFFIVTTQCGPAQIYELVTSSPNDRKTWFRHFQETQASIIDNRDGGRSNRRSQPPSSSQQQEQELDSQPLHDRDGVEDSLDDSEAPDSGECPATPGTSANNNNNNNNNNNSNDSPNDSFAKKTADGNDVSGSNSSAGAECAAGRGSTRRLQEVQIIQIVEDTPLISPSEVTVSQGVVLSAQPVLTPIEHLRRKDLKIKQALKEKQHIIADILGIPREHFETLGDMASEPGSGPKEPRELVLAAIYQANCLQEALNEALTIRESDIVAAKAGGAESANKLSSSLLPLYPAPMSKLMSITGSLSLQLNALLNLVTERDDERDRMRKELVASKERIHQLHHNQSITPTNSRPNSMVSQSSSTPAPDVRDDSEIVSLEERARTGSAQDDLAQLVSRDLHEESDVPDDDDRSGVAAAAAAITTAEDDDAFHDIVRNVITSDQEEQQELQHPPTT
ncbi:pleckstrin homology domain-containing family G member 5 [Hyalella azteca]|uniref:Pleckstrin homology domain-containing family G member 5 n=1 Tax=Hyalella azteca TaxID=294128 RepID=A0A8B7PNQ3_HYAAZ|nr:pleckstrin homology domain-containing family G member 5 [Hyalella azteca]